MKKSFKLSLILSFVAMIVLASCKPNEPTNVTVTGVTVDTQEKTISVGESFTIVATVAPDNATNKDVTWASSNPEIATVDNGAVVGVAPGNAKVTVKTADGGMTATCNVTVIENSVESKRGVLLEDFTADWCGPCYQGMKNIQNVISKFKFGQAILVCHHVNDNFAISESLILANAYKVSGIPAFMVNRMPGISGADILFHPAHLTKAMIDKQLKMENSVKIAIKTTFSEETKELSVDVSGKLLKDFPNARLNVYLVQDSIIAKQAGGGNNYAHRNALRGVLSKGGAWGEPLGVTTGDYSKQYKYTIPEKIGKFATDISKMYVVAFVADHLSTTAADMPKNIVHNATIKKIK
ncbi:MAG: Omp28-related outer membrane protein [Porphyromonadaceae bacterium]|nr:Omp28-related outer membrane protein [Porphyromonadaceae bacterium]